VARCRERLYKQMADILVEEGYRDVGYEYVAVDDCWMERHRDSRGTLQADAKRFPSGIAHLADYVSKQIVLSLSMRLLNQHSIALHSLTVGILSVDITSLSGLVCTIQEEQRK